MNAWNSIVAFFATNKKRFGILGVGLLGNQAMCYAFNWGLYTYIINRLGPIDGFFSMLVLSFITCYLLIRFYDWSGQDWLGIETLKELREYEGNCRFRRVVSWIMKQSDPVVFVFLSIKFDSFITVVYMRNKERAYGGTDGKMDGTDWKVFLISLVVGVIWQTVLVYSALSGVKWLVTLLG